jgi:hypothetical protein
MARASGKNGALINLPKDRIYDLPDVPYVETKNASVVVSTMTESERAVGDI